jgi:hypothetical protein
MKVGTQSIKDHVAHHQLDQLTGSVPKDHETSSPGGPLSHMPMQIAQSKFQSLKRAKVSGLSDHLTVLTILMAHSPAGEEVDTMEKRLDSHLN